MKACSRLGPQRPRAARHDRAAPESPGPRDPAPQPVVADLAPHGTWRSRLLAFRPPVARRRRRRSAPGSLPRPPVRAGARPWAPEGMRTWRARFVGLRAGPRSEGATGSSPGGHPGAPRRERIRPSRAGRLRPPGSLRDTSTRSSGGASESLTAGAPECRRPPRRVGGLAHRPLGRGHRKSAGVR